MPVLLLGLSLFMLGIYLSLPAKTHDDFPGALHSAEQYLAAGNLEDAEKQLRHVTDRITLAPLPEQALHATLWGDLVYMQIDAEPAKFETNDNRKKVHNWYKQAKELGQKFDGIHLQRWADTLVILGRQDEALAVVDQLKDQPPERRYAVLKTLIQQRLKGTREQVAASTQEITDLLQRFVHEVESEPNAGKRRAEEIWATDTQARLGMASSSPQASIDHLLRRIVYFKDQGGDKDLAPLMALLARAYHRAGELGEARRWYRMAQQRLIPTDKLNADVLVGLGQIEVADAGGLRSGESSDIRTALELFTRAETDYPTSPSRIEATIGRADCEARIGAHAEAIDHFTSAVKLVLDDKLQASPAAATLIDTVRSHYSTQFDLKDFRQALDYLTITVPMFADQRELPAKVLLQFASTHESLARQRQGDATQATKSATGESVAFESNPSPKPVAAPVASPLSSAASPVAAASPTTAPSTDDPKRRVFMQEAAVHFAKAADYYVRHAKAVTVSDNEAFGASLWNASACYIDARLWKKAIEVYAEFVRTRPGDPRQLQAMAQLGLAYQADGQPAAAVSFLEQLVAEHPNTPETYSSLVPLARCYVSLGEYDKAKRVLLHVLTEHPTISPDSVTYRQALLEMGKLHYQLREFEPAIERLAKSLEREKKTSDAPTLRFLLADAYRQSVQELNKSLDEGMPQSKKAALQSERVRRIEQALALYTQVVNDLEVRDNTTLSALEKLYHRNAYFYRGDCAYDLGRYEQAISLYDQAANRWRGHPASLVGLVQIVNAYCQLGQTQEAKVANDRAREQLKRIPDDAFNDPSLPMTRQHWQEWLKWTSDMNLFGTQASAEPPRVN
jgi:tetratricopeptide (TPR) repeat protein